MKQTKAKTAKEVLIAAKWILENVGWCKGSLYKDSDGEAVHSGDDEGLLTIRSCCLSGAISLVESQYRTRAKCFALLNAAMGSEHNCVPDFNDDARTTKKDVLALLDAAIRSA